MRAPLALPSPSQPKARTLPARAVLRPPAKTAVGTPVGSFDQSLKYLLQHHAADFLRFGLGTPASLTVLKPLASSLPSTGREMDGAYLVSLRRPGAPDPERWAVDIEFCRRHQPLVPLTRDGKTEEALARTTRTLRARRLPDSDKADLLSALRFLAEAENVPLALLNRYIDRKELKMTKGSLYQEIMQEGRQEGHQEAILLALETRLGKVPQTIRSRVMGESRSRVLSSWLRAAIGATDATSARKVLERIRAAAPPKARSRAA